MDLDVSAFVEEMDWTPYDEAYVEECDFEDCAYVEELDFERKLFRESVVDLDSQLERLNGMVEEVRVFLDANAGVKYSFSEEDREDVKMSSYSFLSEERLSNEIKALAVLKEEGFISREEYLMRKDMLRSAMEDYVPAEEFVHKDYTTLRKVELAKRDEVEERIVRVFLSSTFVDMMEEREHLIKDTFPRLAEYCKSRNIFFVPIDLRWGITSERSELGDTIDICLNEVEKCSPFFIGLLGERYGWSNDQTYSDELLNNSFGRASLRNPWIVKYRDRSITELEIRAGALNNTNKSAIFLFKNSGQSGRSNDPDYKKEKLNRLKEEISSIYNVDYYQSPKALGDIIFDKIRHLIDQLYPHNDVQGTEEKEYLAHKSFEKNRTLFYVSNEKLFSQVDQILMTQKPVMVYGGNGIGKTSFIANYIKHYSNSYPDALVISKYIGKTSNSAELNQLIRLICWEISQHFLITQKIPDDPAQAKNIFSTVLYEASQQGGLLIAIDGLDQLSPPETEFRWLPKNIPDRIKILFSSKSPNQNFSLIELCSQSSSTIHKITQKYLSQFGKELTQEQYARIKNTEQCGNPLFLKVLLDEIRVFGEFERVNMVLNELLVSQTIPELFNKVFERIEKDLENVKIFANLILLISFSRNGLSEDEIMNILHLPASVWGRIRYSLGDYLISTNGLINFFDKSLKEVAKVRYMEHSEHTVRNEIYSFFKNSENERKYEEVPFQLLAMENASLLTNFLIDPVNLPRLYHNYKSDLYQYWKFLQNNIDVPEFFISNIDLRSELDLSLLFSEFLLEVSELKSAGILFKALQSIHSGNMKLKLRLAEYYEKSGSYSKCEPLLESIYDTLKMDNHIDRNILSDVISKLAVIYRRVGKYESSLKFFKKDLRTKKRLFGNQNELIALTYNEMGRLYQSIGDFEKAEMYFQNSISLRTKLLGSNHPLTALSMKDLGDVYVMWNKLDKAKKILDSVLTLLYPIFGENHSLYAETVQSIASMFQVEGKYDESEKYFQRAIILQRRILGDNHPDLARTYSDFASLFLRQRIFDLAEEYYFKALNIRESVLGTAHNDYAITLGSIGSLYQKKKNWSVAERYFLDSLQILTDIYQGVHMDIARAELNVAGVYQQQKKYYDSIPHYNSATRILIDLLGISHTNTAVIIADIALLYYNLDKPELANSTFKKCIQLYNIAFGEQHPSTANVHKNYALFLLSQNRKIEGQEQLTEALNIHNILCNPIKIEEIKTLINENEIN